MCGIAVIISKNPGDLALIEPVTDRLAHRGPDRRGFYKGHGVALGHRRLSILDLSDAATQPMKNETGDLWLVCNGEIYNYQENREKLKARGHRFCSMSDNETLIHLYEEYGDAFLDHVNGMFASAIWDEKNQRLVAVVDRFGKKPLYYSFIDGKLAIASELKSLLAFDWIPKDVDPMAIDRYMTLRHVPAPLSMFKHVCKLEPASMMVYHEGKIEIHRYWEPRFGEEIAFDEKAVDDFEELFTDSVRIRMQSDVPLGVYLSGGVDSAAVAGVMRKQSDERKISYTLTVDYKHDERQRAERLADHLNFEFHPVEVPVGDFDISDKIMYHLDEPFGDILSLASYALARKAREKLTVVLTGDGADEILGGYFHQKIMNTWTRWSPILRAPLLNRILCTATNLAPPSLINLFFDYPDTIGQREKLKLSQTLLHCNRFGEFYEGITSCFTREDKESLYSDSLWERTSDSPISVAFQRDMEAHPQMPLNSRLTMLDLKYWLPYSLIFRLDKLNMAHAIETRSPFLDYRIVEMALALSDKGKQGDSRNKVILRSLIERLYPPQLREKGKQAFYMPVASAYRQKFLEWSTALLNEHSVGSRGLFNWGYIDGLFKQYERGSMLVNRQITCLAMMELWHRIFVDGGYGKY